MKAKCRSGWTAAEDELFRRMIEMKVPAETIALQLRRSVDELRVRAYLIGLPVCTENLIRVADVMESPKLAE